MLWRLLSPLLQSTNQGATMKSVSVKAINNGTVRVLYDPNINKYTIHCVDEKGNAVSHSELSKDQALELIKENTSAQIDPMVSVVEKAISIGIDPSTVYGLG
jgi:hypothetical protein